MTLKGHNYEITAKNVLAHELIGLEARVCAGTDKGRMGLKGIVVDETKNVIVIEDNGVEKKVPKKESSFEFSLGKEKVVVEGKRIMFRPQDRVKVFWRNF